MREPRLYTAQELQINADIILDDRTAHHLRTVLRLSVNSKVRLFNGDGHDYMATVVQIDARTTKVRLTAQQNAERIGLSLHLLLGISKGERMDITIQKAVELGVTRISPVLVNRNVVQLQAKRLESRYQHWQQIVIAACEQCGRARLPQLDYPRALEEVIKIAEGDCHLLLYHLGTVKMASITPPQHGVAILVGPEGGLAAAEIQLARAYDFYPIRLGPRILRTETAPLAALAAVQTLWGDFNT